MPRHFFKVIKHPLRLLIKIWFILLVIVEKRLLQLICSLLQTLECDILIREDELLVLLEGGFLLLWGLDADCRGEVSGFG